MKTEIKKKPDSLRNQTLFIGWTKQGLSGGSTLVTGLIYSLDR